MSRWIDEELINKFLQFLEGYFFRISLEYKIYPVISGIFILKFYYTGCSAIDNKKKKV